MTTPNLLLEEALRIAELGYKVLPCSQDKKPILKGWPEKATTDAEQIKAWFSNTDYLVAVKTGPETNLFVLDVDPKGTGWLAENQHRMLCERIHQNSPRPTFSVQVFCCVERHENEYGGQN